MLELDELLRIFNEGIALEMDEEAAMTCNYYSQEAQKITCELNYKYHDFEEIRELFSKLIGEEVSEDFRVFPPFTTDFGKNIHLGKNVFINSGCRFQDQGGIYIGDNVLIARGNVALEVNGVFIFNETGALLWNALDQYMTAEELAERLVCAYSIDREQAVRDVNKCLEKMNSHNLIEVKEM